VTTDGIAYAPPAVCPGVGAPTWWVRVHVVPRKECSHLSPILWMCGECGVVVEGAAEGVTA